MPEHVEINCATQGCYAIITLHPADAARLRRTHETFYCPAGHHNYFAGKTDDEKRLERLRDSLDRANERSYQRTLLVRHFVNAIQVCPFGCGWVGSRRLSEWNEASAGRFLDRVGHDLSDHLQHDHNATRKPIALLTAGEKG